MKKKLKKLYSFIYESALLILHRKNLIPIKYFSKRPNVGDALNVYMIEKISGKKALEINSGWIPHLLGIGSIMHFASKKSIAWGTGVIEPSQLPSASILTSMHFSAIRGSKTKELLEQKLGRHLNCAMGDPGVLMPFYYTPSFKKKHALGVVPHYVDKQDAGFKDFISMTDAKVIDVELPVEEFLDQLAECEVIISSSLHGLILSDAYSIPNIWVRFSDRLIGGDFKFLDYYSTTDKKNPVPVDFRKIDLVPNISEKLVSEASVAYFLKDKIALLKSFPTEF